VDEHWGLGGDGGGGLAVGQAGRIADGEYVGVLDVLRGGLVDVDPTTFVG